MKRLAVICGMLLTIVLVACQDPPPAPPLTPAPAAGPEPTVTPTISAEAAAFMAMLEETAGDLSAETEACLMDLFEADPSIAESFGAEEELSGPSMLSVIACLTPEEAAALTPPGESPPDVAGFACLTAELEGAPERERILAVITGDDPSGDGLTPEQSAVLGEAVEACDIDTGFSFPEAAGDGENPLADTEWRLVALGDADAPAPVVGGEPTARFTTETDLTGWTGCNAYGARYRVRESELRLDDLSWQEAGCPSDALFRLEQRMQDALAAIERFELSEEQLTLHSEGGQVLVFERVEQ